MATTLHRKCKDGRIKTWSTSGNFQGGKVEVTCQQCETGFKVFKYRKDNAKFCSKSCLASSKVGKDSKNWKGGISDENKRIRGSEEYNVWRKSVYARDNWTCQECHLKQRHPVAHHILTFKEYPELRFEIDNGQTLCRSCHKKVHADIGQSTRFSRNDAAAGVLTLA